METNKKIYESLVKRDSKEKEVVLCRLVEANDKLMTLINTLKTDLDETTNKLERVETRNNHLNRRIVELETLLKLKNDIISKLSNEQENYR